MTLDEDRIQSHPCQLLEQFSRNMRCNFTSESIPFRNAYLQSLIEVIEVDDTQIRIKGSKDVLESDPGQPERRGTGSADEY